jgi:cephalosporin-C deacetylase
VSAPYPPEDFDEFWLETVEEVRREPLGYWRRRAPERDTATHLVDWIGFRGAHGAALEGWLAYPEGASRAPAFLWVPPYGRESLPPDAFGTREGMTSMSLNLHGLGAFHREAYDPARGYFAEGAGSPRTWVFRRLFQHCLVAARVLQAQLEADEDRVGAMGMSQGGGIALWLAAFSPVVRAVCADMPFLAAMPAALSKPVHRYPMKELQDYMESAPLGRERLTHTLAYFDTLNVATRVARPALVSLGLKDPASVPETVRAVYDAIPGRAALMEYPGGHDWHPGMIEANRDWLLATMT